MTMRVSLTPSLNNPLKTHATRRIDVESPLQPIAIENWNRLIQL
jgi:hypothetical protein